MPPRKKYSCKFPKCNNSYYWSKGVADKIINKRFYRFPKNLDISTKWKMICGINISTNCRNMYICEDHFCKEDFVNFTKHLLKPNIVPKHIETSDNLVMSQISATFENNSANNNYCQPIVNETSATCNDSNNNEVNINMCDPVSDKTSAYFYDTSMFQNVQVHNSNNNQLENSAKLNLTNVENDENKPICICDNEECREKESIFSNELQLDYVSTTSKKKENLDF